MDSFWVGGGVRVIITLVETLWIMHDFVLFCFVVNLKMEWFGEGFGLASVNRIDEDLFPNK